METRVAVIADVADSRRVGDFPGRRDRLLADLSRRHRLRGWIGLDYAVTAWDEFQGLWHEPSTLPAAVWDLWKAFQPMSLRLALGIGQIERVPGHGKQDALNKVVTGPAFYRAREALDALDSPRHGMSRVRVRVAAEDARIADGCNAVLRLADALTQDITERQWEVIGHYEQCGRQTEVAEALEVSESTVSRSLASARYREIHASLTELEQWLAAVIGDTEPGVDSGA